jgi:2'-5' RNA ligase
LVKGTIGSGNGWYERKMLYRLFIGIQPPAPVRQALIDTMEALDGARWQDDEQLHLTLRFVGEVERDVANDLAAALAGIAMPQFELALAGVSHFERKGMPTSIWANVRPAPELLRLRTKIERVCELAGINYGTRRFTPHITIARLNRHSGPIANWLIRHTGLHATWQVNGFSLFESHLLTPGAQYEVVAFYPLYG